MTTIDRLVRRVMIIGLFAFAVESAYHFSQSGNPADLALFGMMCLGAVALLLTGNTHA